MQADGGPGPIILALAERSMVVYTARFLLPVAGPPVPDGAVAVEDGIVRACGPRGEVLAGAPGAKRRDLGPMAVLPGLVNAHTHLELSWMVADRPPAGDWTRWVRGLLERRGSESRERTEAAAAEAAAQAVARGTVAVGDVSNRGWTAGATAGSGLHGVLFHEVYGSRDADAARLADEAFTRVAQMRSAPEVRAARGRLRVTATPHAPHTTSPGLLRALAAAARDAGEVVSIHVAESRAESDFLRDGSGAFARLVAERGGGEAPAAARGLSPVAYLDTLGLLGPRTLVVHAVRLEPGDAERLAACGATVVTCPRSNRRLGVGVAPVPELLEHGVAVALGTDSLASVEDLDMFAEIAALAVEHPAIPRETLLRIATVNGAAALGLGDRLGTIAPGRLARLVVVPLGADGDALAAACSNPPEVWPLERAPCRAAP